METVQTKSSAVGIDQIASSNCLWIPHITVYSDRRRLNSQPDYFYSALLSQGEASEDELTHAAPPTNILDKGSHTSLPPCSSRWFNNYPLLQSETCCVLPDAIACAAAMSIFSFYLPYSVLFSFTDL